ncbi:MAG: cobyric acid synthase [Thaumarchaeota archaeon]|nr:cobyric acid synthase [Nitrososphaerota archaeon]
MVQGTSSHCGKSLMVAALCRIFSNAGYRVAPFKAQNMSLNSFVTNDGKEIARAQAVQAIAARTEPTSDMNPILLKPKGNMTSQIVLNGTPYIDISASNYYSDFARGEGIHCLKESLKRLEADFEIVVIEGAGSPAEINLYDHEIANMRVADIVDAPVILVGDIDRGGVFASIVGTLELLKPRHRRRIKGFVINKFRGDLAILKPGLVQLQRITKKPMLGVVPFIEGLQLPSEDSVALEDLGTAQEPQIDIAIIHLPRISNFTDYEPFKMMTNVRTRYVKSEAELGDPDSIILPGTKNTIQDLLWLEKSGLVKKIVSMAKNRPILGVCGGYQILGKRIIDKDGIEGKVKGEFKGLGLLDVVTYFEKYGKVTERISAESFAWTPIFGSLGRRKIMGYEIHMGRTVANNSVRPAFKIIRRSENTVNINDGAVSNDGLVIGTYVHGLFENEGARNALIKFLMQRRNNKPALKKRDSMQVWQESLDRLASVVESSLNMKKLFKMLDLSG